MKLVFGVGLMACSCAAPGDFSFQGERELSIYQGAPVPAPAAVVLLETAEGSGLSRCTGVLLTPHLIASAAHCVTGQGALVDCARTRLGTPLPPELFSITTAADVRGEPELGRTYHSIRATHLVAPVGALLCGNDLALLELEAPIPADEAVPLSVSPTPVSTGTSYRAMGYGAVHSSGTGDGARRISASMTVTCVGKECEGAILFGAAGADPRPTPVVTDSEFLGGPGACPGDSGGPALSSSGEILGFASRGTEVCAEAVYSLPFALAPLVRDLARRVGDDVPLWARASNPEAPSQPEPDASSGGHAGEPPFAPPLEEEPETPLPTGCSAASLSVRRPKSNAWLCTAPFILLACRRRHLVARRRFP